MSILEIKYLCKFDEEGNRTETYVTGIHFTDETDEFVQQKLADGFIWVSDEDYNNLLGNNADNQVYVRNSDGTFKPKPPYVPTAEELLEREASTTKTKMVSMKDDLLFAMLKGENTAPIISNYSVSLMSISDEVAEKIPEVFPTWDSNGKQYKVGDRVQYNDVLYKVLQDHTSQSTWTPVDAPSLFAKVLTSTTGEPQEWQQPDSTNGYKTGDRVIYNGKIYESTIDNNVWSPEAYPAGWKEITEG